MGGREFPRGNAGMSGSPAPEAAGSSLRGARGAGRARALPARTFALFVVLSSALGIAAPGGAARAADFDRARWAEFLQTHTMSVDDIAGTRVDYEGLRSSGAWRAFVAGLDAVAPPTGRDARMAFWIDVYNVLAIDMVVRNWPVDSIRDIGSFFRPVWGKPAGRVGGRVVTLHEIEHEILRPMGDPRIHMAIVCASTSCPSLAREPFAADQLDAQLDAAVKRFLADPRKGMKIDRERDTLMLSRIFDWFSEDFDSSDGVRGFVAQHAEGIDTVSAADLTWLRARRSRIRLRYFDYDWQVNAISP